MKDHFDGVVLNLAFARESLHHIGSAVHQTCRTEIHLNAGGREVVGAGPLVQAVFNGIHLQGQEVSDAGVKGLVHRLVLERAVV